MILDSRAVGASPILGCRISKKTLIAIVTLGVASASLFYGLRISARDANEIAIRELNGYAERSGIPAIRFHGGRIQEHAFGSQYRHVFRYVSDTIPSHEVLIFVGDYGGYEMSFDVGDLEKQR